MAKCKANKRNIKKLATKNISLSKDVLLLLANFPVALILTDASQHIVYVNKQFQQLTGYKLREIKGKHCSLLFDGTIPNNNKGELLEKIPNHQIPIELCKVKCKDGTLKHLYKSSGKIQRQLSENKIPPLWLNVFIPNGAEINQKLVERTKELEEAHKVVMQMSKALEAANQELNNTNIALEKAVERANQMALEAAAASTARSRFLANVSHEIRTPLNGIIGMIALTMETPLTVEQMNYLKMAKDSADNLLEIINDILDFSKMEADRFEIEEIEFNLWELIGKVTKPLAIKAYEKSLRFIVQLGSNVPSFAYGDPTRIRQVLANLINNAIKFTEQGIIKIKVDIHRKQPEKLSSRAAKNFMLECRVIDTGIGISKKNLSLIFDPFSQADSSVPRKFGGTGLGLSISRHLARLMGGNIEVTSEEGVGSSFKATFILKSTEDIMTLKTLAEELNNKQFAIIMGDENVRNSLTESLIDAGLQVFPFNSIEAFYSSQFFQASSKNRLIAILIDDEVLFHSNEQLVKEVFCKIEEPLILAELPSALVVDKSAIDVSFATVILKPIVEYEVLEALLQIEKGKQFAAIHKLPASYDLVATLPKMKFLIAEDNFINLRLMEQLLINLGHNVVSTTSGKRAIELLEQQKFDALFLDIQMPDMDGFTVAKRIRRWAYPDASITPHIAENRRHASTMPIVALTANILPQDKNKCRASGMNLFLGKPVAKEALLSVLAYIAKQKIPIPPEILLQETNTSVVNDALPLDLPPILDIENAIGRTSESPEFIKELIKIFLSVTPKTIENLNATLASENQDKAEEIAHTLKGSAAALGAERMRLIASQIEDMAKNKEWHKAMEEMKKLEQCFKETLIELEKFLNKA